MTNKGTLKTLQVDNKENVHVEKDSNFPQKDFNNMVFKALKSNVVAMNGQSLHTTIKI